MWLVSDVLQDVSIWRMVHDCTKAKRCCAKNVSTRPLKSPVTLNDNGTKYTALYNQESVISMLQRYEKLKAENTHGLRIVTVTLD